MDDLFNRIVSCMDELADAKGISRCSLMYALAQLIDAYHQEVDSQISKLKKEINELNARTASEEEQEQ